MRSTFSTRGYPVILSIPSAKEFASKLVYTQPSDCKIAAHKMGLYHLAEVLLRIQKKLAVVQDDAVPVCQSIGMLCEGS